MKTNKKNMLKAICFIIIFVVISSFWNKFFISLKVKIDDTLVYTKMNYLYSQDAVDLVVFGPSTVYVSFNPVYFERALGINCFNTAFFSMNIKDYYYVLKDVFRVHNPKYVLVDLSFFSIAKDMHEKNQSSSQNLFWGIQWSPVKAEYLFDAFTVDKYPESIFIYLQNNNRENMLKWIKIADEHQKYAEYVYKGFIRTTKSNKEVQNGHAPKPNISSLSEKMPVSPSSIKYLDQIVSLCRENSAEVILFETPRMPSYVFNIEDYALFYDFMESYAEKENLAYLNFNFLKPSQIRYSENMFIDEYHMNNNLSGVYSEMFSKILSEYLNGTLDKDSYFYKDYDEFYRGFKDVAVVWIDNVEDRTVTARSLEGDIAVEYRFSVAVDDEEPAYEVFREYDSNPSAVISELDAGEYRVKVEARPVGGMEEYSQMATKKIALE